MKSYELQPTNENLFQTFQEDAIDRNKDICRFIELLYSIDDSCAIALDGRWGSGKTFFVKQTKMILDTLNDAISQDEEKSNLIRTCLNNYIELDENQPHVSVYYDAWSNDNDVDPVLSLVYEIILPIMIALKMSDSTRYNLFIQGELNAPLIDVLTDAEIVEMICRRVLCGEETEGSDKISVLRDRLAKIYEVIFIQDYSPKIDVGFGRFEFSAGTKRALMRAVSLLSDFSTFE